MAGINVLLQALICRIDCFDQPVLTCNLQKLLAVSSLTVACLYHSCFWCFLLLLKNYEKNKNWGHNEMYPFIHLISFVVVSIWSAILNDWNVPKRSGIDFLLKLSWTVGLHFFLWHFLEWLWVGFHTVMNSLAWRCTTFGSISLMFVLSC